MRRLLVILLPVLAAWGLTAVPAAAVVRPVSVLSFNIHHAAGQDGRLDLDRLVAEIRASRADVIGLQEVDRHFGERSGWADQPAELAARLGMHVVFGANLDLAPPAPGAPRRQYGTAVLSRYPILRWHNTLLPKGDPAEEQRGLLEAVIDAGHGPVRVMSTHLQHDSAATRRAQAAAVALLVGDSAEPVLLTGDLNATPEAAELAPLLTAMTDSHLAGHGDGFTYPVQAPTKRIDYVLTEQARPVVSRVLPTSSSDHQPVLARVLVSWR